jgi:hypothetical protein
VSTRHLLDGCVTGKRCYPTAADAHDALLSTRIAAALRDTHHRRREQRCYVCPHCGHWHLSSSPDRPLTSRQRRNRRHTLAWLARHKLTIP